LQFSPEKCVKIIGACFRLHNKALDDRLPLVVDEQIPILDNNHIVDAIESGVKHKHHKLNLSLSLTKTGSNWYAKSSGK
jgi:transcriptional regulatory protein LevR